MPWMSSLMCGKVPTLDMPEMRTVSWRLRREIEGVAAGQASREIQCTFLPLQMTQGAFKLLVMLDAMILAF